MTKKRASVEDVCSMEDSDYRDLMREELMHARRSQAVPRPGGIGTVAITLFLMIATAAILLHHFGFIELPK